MPAKPGFWGHGGKGLGVSQTPSQFSQLPDFPFLDRVPAQGAQVPRAQKMGFQKPTGQDSNGKEPKAHGVWRPGSPPPA